MIRAIRPQAMAQDDAALISGWNISPNVAYVVQLNPGSSACGVLVYNEYQTAIIASGAGLVGTDQPVILHAYSGQTLGMIDAELGWHVLLTTDGTEYQRTVRIGPAVDLPDEIHPIYADDDLAVVRARAGIDEHAHYPEDISVTCPLGFDAWIGDIAVAPVDGVALTGQAESLTWTGTPNGTSDAVVIRRHVAIAPVPHVDPVPIVPPTVADDTAETDAVTEASGNVLTNDESGLTIVAVNGLVANLGEAVAGSDGGLFTIAEDGAWTFDPNGDFSTLSGLETAETSVTYHASDGVSEASTTLTVTVSAVADPVHTDDRWGDVVFCINATGADGSTTITDAKGLTVSRFGDTQVDTALGYPAVQFDGTGDYLTLPNSTGTKIESGVFTLDGLVYRDGTGRRGIVGNRPSGSTVGGVIIGFNSSNQVWIAIIGGSSYAAPYTVPAGLNHIEVSIDSSRLCRIFVNGVLRGSSTIAAGTASSAALQIGREQDGATTEMLMARVPSLRLTRGATVRHTDAFTPPSYPFPTA